MKSRHSNNGSRATLQDIAKRAGVSAATVSLALNNKGHINAKTRERIKNIAASLNYTPNLMAQALRGGRTNTIGVVINHMHNPFFAGVFNGIEHVADQLGFTYLVSHTLDQLDKEKQQVRLFAERGVDGLIVLPCSNESNHIAAIEDEFQIPLALIGNFFEGGNFLSVVADNWGGGRMAVEHLISLGRRPVVHIAGPSKQSMCQFRRRAFEQVMSESFSDVLLEDRVFSVPAMTPDEGYRVMDHILKLLPIPLSLFVTNDDTALGVLRYCNEKRLKIPDDIAIVGFSDIEILKSLNIPLTTVRIPAREMGEKVANLVINAIESGKIPSKERIVLPVELIIRDSTLMKL
jgi:LacI family transcriptional regulator